MKRIACLAWLCCALGYAVPAHADRLSQQVNLASAGWPLGDFTLTDHHGAPFTRDNLRGRWTLLLLDSQCRGPCETALAALAGLFRRIHETQAIKTIQVVLILPDSPAGSPKRMGQYLAGFNPHFIGARGSRSTLQGIADDLGATRFGQEYEESPENIPRSGAGSIWVIGPDGILRSELLPPFDVPRLTAEFMKTRARR